MTHIYIASNVTTDSKYASKWIFWIGGNIEGSNNVTHIYTTSTVTSNTKYANKYIF